MFYSSSVVFLLYVLNPLVSMETIIFIRPWSQEAKHDGQYQYRLCSVCRMVNANTPSYDKCDFHRGPNQVSVAKHRWSFFSDKLGTFKDTVSHGPILDV